MSVACPGIPDDVDEVGSGELGVGAQTVEKAMSAAVDAYAESPDRFDDGEMPEDPFDTES